jgi:hypothetical protein
MNNGKGGGEENGEEKGCPLLIFVNKENRF